MYRNIDTERIKMLEPEKKIALIRALQEKGFSKEFAEMIAGKYLNTEYTATRMLGYLYRMDELTEELVVDEMLAIISDRDRIMKKHEMEEAQAAVNRIYQYGLGVEEEDET